MIFSVFFRLIYLAALTVAFVCHLPLPQAAPPVSLPPSVGCDVENRLRHATQRIRVSEFFKDFDPLRTGFITSEPFVIVIVAILDTDLCQHLPSSIQCSTGQSYR